MKILVLTSIYKDPEDSKDSEMTPVVHYFARQWVRMGHEVEVIHNFNTYLLPIYFIPKNILFKRTNFRVSLNLKQRKEKHYFMDGVSIHRIPIKKSIPRGPYSKHRLNNQLKRILVLLKDRSFIPDVIVGHAENPQIFQLYKLKKEFPKARTSIVFHGIEYLNRAGFEEWKDVYLNSIDKYGFRSESVHRKAQEKIGFNKTFFLCPSGIDDNYIIGDSLKGTADIHKILYVGQLIERKHLKTVIEALARKSDYKYELTVIGAGVQESEDRAFANELGVSVCFKGKLPHETVIDEMRKAGCFVMVSENEVFGLVYLEAMAQGCITIASEKEGMEGIIIDGKNGFLAKAGDTDSLCEVLDHIRQLSEEKKQSIRIQSLLTAREFSESAVAQKYLSNVIS